MVVDSPCPDAANAVRAVGALVQPGAPPASTVIEDAAQRLADGALVAFPTETVYGLGARADDDAAVAAVYAAKGRPTGHPLIVHLAEPGDAAGFAADWPPAAQRLVAAFWPGPLTLIVRRVPGVASAAAAGQPTIGLRCPAHPLARALLRAAAARGVPGVAAPSANRFGRVSPTTAAHVRAEFAATLPSLNVVDGGDCAVGIESAIVDVSRGRPVLLRPGVLTRAEIEATLGEPLLSAAAAATDIAGANTPRAPGTLAAHYAPAARVCLFGADALAAALRARASSGQPARGLAVYSRGAALPSAVFGPLCWRTMPDDAVAAAHELFSVLREFDAAGVHEIWVEQPPDTPAWEGVRDRLKRAAAA